MGLPFVGETIQFFSPHRLYDIPPCISKRVARHGVTMGEVEVKGAAADMIFDYFAKKLFGYHEKKACKKLRENYKAFIDGLISFPLNFPGTAYHACLQGHKNATKVIKDAFSER
ncbi:hypothetical protein RJ639_033241 [Escallonia herrerae]|uniref:Uncharacterized protein n=1 Tax=Escallonia herrerae TaxID=1293975 RepID=A0AA88WVI0_9ASTE|nr:hypothetical protein RJ639_033241 [Escallonia herrerae]